MKTWLRQHAFALTDALRHARRPRGGFLLNVLVIAIALALPFAGLTLLENVRPIADQLMVEPEISIFLNMDASRDSATALAPGIRRILQRASATHKIEFVPREKALAKLKERTGLSDALTTLGTNPLPDAYIVKLTDFQSTANAADIGILAAQLKALPGVDSVQIDSAWVKRLAALLHILRMALLILAITLGIVVVAVVFNTIRLQVMNQREEIEVSRLVGATNAYIYRPFYYAGALLGLCAGCVALLAVFLALQPMNGAIAEFASLYGSAFRLTNLSAVATLLLLVLSAGLGFVGAMLSVKRYLD